MLELLCHHQFIAWKHLFQVEICGPDHFCGELSLFMGESRKNKLVPPGVSYFSQKKGCNKNSAILTFTYFHHQSCCLEQCAQRTLIHRFGAMNICILLYKFIRFAWICMDLHCIFVLMVYMWRSTAFFSISLHESQLFYQVAVEDLSLWTITRSPAGRQREGPHRNTMSDTTAECMPE